MHSHDEKTDVCMYVFINLHFGEHACKNTGTKV